MSDNDTYIIDFYNPNIYPDDQKARKGIKREVFIQARDTDKTYLAKMKKVIEQDIENFKAEFEKRSQQLQSVKSAAGGSTAAAAVTPAGEPSAGAAAAAPPSAASPLSSPEGSR